MAERTQGSASKPQPSRLALITPSASPPITTPQKARSSSTRPPPSKRPRLSATPSSSLSRSTPNLSSPASTEQSLQDARRASQLNVINFWDSLADRYNVPIDEDDIFDFRKDKLVKDRGYLRRVNKTLHFGCFGGAAEDDASSDTGGAQTEGEELDDEFDELDSFAPGAEISAELEKSMRRLMPLKDMNPMDSEDLKQFMEAEERRKETMGDDDIDDEDDETADVLDALASGSGWNEEDDDLASYGDVASPDGYDEPGPPESSSDGLTEPVIQHVLAERALTPNDDSDDEFATWEIDEEPIPVVRPTPRSKSRSRPPLPPEHEIIDLTSPSPSPPGSPLASRGSDSRPSTPTPKPTSRAKYKAPARKIREVSPLKPPAAIQLQTPPLSSPSHASFQDDLLDFNEPLPRSSPSPSPLSSPTPLPAALRPKPIPSSLHKVVKTAPITSVYEEGDEIPGARRSSPSIPLPTVDFSRSTSSPRPKSKPQTPSSKQVGKGAQARTGLAPSQHQTSTTRSRSTAVTTPVTPRKHTLLAEVVIPIRPRNGDISNSPRVPSSVTPERVRTPRKARTNNTPEPQSSSKGKGKAKDLGTDISEEDLDPSERGPSTLPNLSPVRAASRKSERATPQHSSKRKRVSPSSSSEEDVKPLPRKSPSPSKREPSRRTLRSDTSNVNHDPKKPVSEPPSASSEISGKSPQYVWQWSDSFIYVFVESESDVSVEKNGAPSKARTPSIRTISRMSPPLQDPYGRPYPLGNNPDQSSYPPPPTIYPIQDPQAQYYFFQAVQHLSYLMSGVPPGYPQHPPVNWPPLTPKQQHRRKKTDRKDPSQSSPNSNGPSSSSVPSSSRMVRSNQTLYPSMYNSGYSSGTLPPSSPPISSPSSPVQRPKSAIRSQSKPRGRRVSFKLDANERPFLYEREVDEDDTREDDDPQGENDSDAEAIPSDREMSPEIPLSSPSVARYSSPKKSSTSKARLKSPLPMRKSVDRDGR
ncbi:hypothetical protein NLI96_g4557 [Meripilus lineatus]|uniref:Uncharacterized protein n=1 Tax=Meripilus lineatus TaxID=2056292 RepID=A0AAD5YK02_9APHY|nr:hypothetical protein NLI96_g4557 [Physisporinus lineatus]